jgi:Uma2 family endonuclease
VGASTLISLDEYLSTSYEPDMDFVDGVLVRRNVGTQRHGALQLLLGIFFHQVRRQFQIHPFIETRLLVNKVTGRHRIPDVVVVTTPYRKDKVIIDVPAIIVEIKSPDDRFDEIIDRCFDYEALAVANILVMDPDSKRAWRFVDGGLLLIGSEVIQLGLPQGRSLPFPVAELFGRLDED